MKKCIVLLLSLALLPALLSACEMFVPGPTERPSHWWGSAEPTGSAGPAGSAEPSPSQALWREGSGTDYDHRFSVYVINKICATEDTVYFSEYLGGNLIYYADKATGICLPLCGKPECTHRDENCNAYVASSGPACLTSYNGRLYWVGSEKINNNWKDCIVSAAYDGTDRKVVRELTDWWDSSNRTYANLQLKFHRGYIYKGYIIDEVENGEAKKIAYVKAFPVEDDREAFVVLREEVPNSVMLNVQCYEEYVYIAIEETADGAFALYRCDTRVGELETLYRGEPPFDWVREYSVTEDGVVFLSKEYAGPDGDIEEVVLYRFTFDTGEFELLNRFRYDEGHHTGTILSDEMVIVNWRDADSGSLRVMANTFEGETVLDATFEDVEWLISSSGIAGYGADESYLYFFDYLRQFIAVPWDGSEIRLLWSKDT